MNDNNETDGGRQKNYDRRLLLTLKKIELVEFLRVNHGKISGSKNELASTTASAS
jgi:hypothetical protein